MSSHKSRRPVPGRSSIKSTNRAEAPSRNVAFLSQYGGSSHLFNPQQNAPIYLDDDYEDEDDVDVDDGNPLSAYYSHITKTSSDMRGQKLKANPGVHTQTTARDQGSKRSRPSRSRRTDTGANHTSRNVEELGDEPSSKPFKPFELEVDRGDPAEFYRGLRELVYPDPEVRNRLFPKNEAGEEWFAREPEVENDGESLVSNASEYDDEYSEHDGEQTGGLNNYDQDELYESLGLANIMNEKGPVVGHNETAGAKSTRDTKSINVQLATSSQIPRKSRKPPREKTGAERSYTGRPEDHYSKNSKPPIETLAGLGSIQDSPALTPYEKGVISAMKAEIPDYSDLEEERLRAGIKASNPPENSEYENKLIEQLRAEARASKNARRNASKKHTEPIAAEAPKNAPDPDKGISDDFWELYYRRRGAYTFVLLLLIWMLHGTLFIDSFPVPCPRHIILSPSKTAYRIGTAIVSIPAAVACSVLPCKSNQRTRLRTIDMLAKKVQNDYNTYKAFAVSIDAFKDSTYLTKVAERLDPTNEEYYGGPTPSQQVIRAMTQTRANFKVVNTTLEDLMSNAKTIAEFTAETILGNLEYLTNQIPRDFLIKLSLPRKWDTNVSTDSRHDSIKKMLRRSKRDTSEMIKAFDKLLVDLDTLDWQINNALQLTTVLIDLQVLYLDPLIDETRIIYKVIKELRQYTAWCIERFREQLHYDKRKASDDSVKADLDNVQEAWESVLSFDSASVGKRRRPRKLVK